MNWVTIGATQAFDLAVVQDGTGVLVSGRYRLGGASGPKVHGLQTVSHLASAVATTVGVTQAQLALVVTAPTLHLKTTTQQAM